MRLKELLAVLESIEASEGDMDVFLEVHRPELYGLVAAEMVGTAEIKWNVLEGHYEGAFGEKAVVIRNTTGE